MSTKLFVGNLSFKTREPDLAKFFEAIGPVKSTNIIARGPRSLGYGFVEMETEADAAKAAETLNKKELDGRPINVECAKPRDPTAAPTTSALGTRPAPSAAPLGGSGGAARRRPRFPRRPPGTDAPAAAGAAPAAAAPQGQAPAAAAAAAAPPRRRPPPPRAAQAAAPAVGTGTAPNAARPPRAAPRRRTMPRRTSGTPSKTTLFVANLPFLVDDGGLLEIFEGMNVKEAHVVCRPNGRSKGYGFVTFANEEDQRRALEAVDKTIVEGRDITVSAALEPIRKPDAPAAASPAAPAPAAAPAASAAPAPAPAPESGPVSV